MSERVGLSLDVARMKAGAELDALVARWVVGCPNLMRRETQVVTRNLGAGSMSTNSYPYQIGRFLRNWWDSLTATEGPHYYCGCDSPGAFPYGPHNEGFGMFKRVPPWSSSDSLAIELARDLCRDENTDEEPFILTCRYSLRSSALEPWTAAFRLDTANHAEWTKADGDTIALAIARAAVLARLRWPLED